MSEKDTLTRIQAARKWAEWHLGDPSHADDILYAYEHPEYVRSLQKREE